MGYKVNIKFSRECSSLDPKEKQLVIAGQPVYLTALTFDDVSRKFGGRISKEVVQYLNSTTFHSIFYYVYSYYLNICN